MRSHLKHGFDSIRGSVLEIMARNMPAADVQYLAAKWGLSKVDPPNSAQKVIDTSGAVTKPEIVLKEAVVEELAKAEKSVSAAAEKQVYKSKALLHPVLGELVCELSYKKVYLTSVKALAAAPVWQKQRTLRVQRAAMIVKNKKKNATSSILPGVISMYHDQNTDEIGIFDGQHRAAALVLLTKEGLWDEWERNITVDVFPTSSEAEVKTLFSEVNAAEPVKLIDMPVVEEPATQPSEQQPLDVRPIIGDAIEELAKKYSEMFKESQNCRPPHCNIDVCRDDLFQSEYLAKRNVTTAAQLLACIEDTNKELEKEFEKKKNGKKTDKTLEKARKFRFYLGLDKAWVHRDLE